MNAITLHKMKFFAYHGVGEQERVVGNHFEVTLKVYCPMEKAMTDDDLDGTVNYADLYATVEAEMAKPSLLLENVAYRITQAHHSALRERFALLSFCFSIWNVRTLGEDSVPVTVESQSILVSLPALFVMVQVARRCHVFSSNASAACCPIM